MSGSPTPKSFEPGSASARRTPIKFERDIVAVVETDVDDVTGEILGRTIEKIMAEGAYDSIVIPYLGKKGRPGQLIRVVCSADSAERFAQVLVEETGTLGVKISEMTRLIVPRKEVLVPISIDSFRGTVKVKVAEIRGKYRIKPELAEAKQIAEALKIPLREVIESITFAARQLILNDPRILRPENVQ